MKGFEQAQKEYESKLFDPFGDEQEEGEMTKEEYLEWQAECQMEEYKLGEL